MNQVLGRTAGNAVEVRESIDHLTGAARDPRLLEVTLALCAELLVLGGLHADVRGRARRRGRRARQRARQPSGSPRWSPSSAARRTCSTPRSRYLPQAPVVAAGRAGACRASFGAIDVRAVGDRDRQPRRRPRARDRPRRPRRRADRGGGARRARRARRPAAGASCTRATTRALEPRRRRDPRGVRARRSAGRRSRPGGRGSADGVDAGRDRRGSPSRRRPRERAARVLAGGEADRARAGSRTAAPSRARGVPVR